MDKKNARDKGRDFFSWRAFDLFFAFPTNLAERALSPNHGCALSISRCPLVIPRKELVNACPPLEEFGDVKSLGMCRRVANKGAGVRR